MVTLLTVIFNFIFSSIIVAIARGVDVIVEWLINLVINVDIAQITDFVPMMKALYPAMLGIAMGLFGLFVMWELFKAVAAPFGLECDSPTRTIARALVIGPIVIMSGRILPLFVDALQSACSKILTLANTSQFNGSWASDIITQLYNKTQEASGGTTVSSVLTMSGAIGLFEFIIVFICSIILVFNVLKLVLEVIERYVLAVILIYTCPLPFATAATVTTRGIFQSWVKMFASHLIVLMLNTWGLAVVLDTAARISSQGDILLGFIVLIALIKILQLLDENIRALGLSTPKTGRNMLEDLRVIGTTLRTIGNGVRIATGRNDFLGRNNPNFGDNRRVVPATNADGSIKKDGNGNVVFTTARAQRMQNEAAYRAQQAGAGQTGGAATGTSGTAAAYPGSNGAGTGPSAPNRNVGGTSPAGTASAAAATATARTAGGFYGAASRPNSTPAGGSVQPGGRIPPAITSAAAGNAYTAITTPRVSSQGVAATPPARNIPNCHTRSVAPDATSSINGTALDSHGVEVASVGRVSGDSGVISSYNPETNTADYRHNPQGAEQVMADIGADKTGSITSDGSAFASAFGNNGLPEEMVGASLTDVVKDDNGYLWGKYDDANGDEHSFVMSSDPASFASVGEEHRLLDINGNTWHYAEIDSNEATSIMRDLGGIHAGEYQAQATVGFVPDDVDLSTDYSEDPPIFTDKEGVAEAARMTEDEAFATLRESPTYRNLYGNYNDDTSLYDEDEDNDLE